MNYIEENLRNYNSTLQMDSFSKLTYLDSNVIKKKLLKTIFIQASFPNTVSYKAKGGKIDI